MKVQPVKNYHNPKYPTLAQTINEEIYKDHIFSKRQKALITAAAIMMLGTLSGCVRTSGEAIPEPTPEGTAAPLMYSNEYDVLRTLTGMVNENKTALRDLGNAARISDYKQTLSENADFNWNEENDIKAAFSEFLDWMKAEGVI